MADFRTGLFRATLDALYYSRAYTALAGLTSGVGVIFTLHQVRLEEREGFAPNRILEVTQDFLKRAVDKVREHGLDIVDMDEARHRLLHGGAPFAVFTFDDGYRDNYELALPVMQAADAPMTVYVPTSFMQGCGQLWWLALERIIARTNSIDVTLAGEPYIAACDNEESKWEVFNTIYWAMRGMEEDEQRAFIEKLAEDHGYSLRKLCDCECLSWDELADFAGEKGVQIGAHTVHHYALARLDEDMALEEMREGRRILEERLGRPVRHFSFPYGGPDSAGARDFALAERLGFHTAVTTRPGVLYPEHARHLTALPRVSLNGAYQKERYIDVFLSGVPFALYNGFRRVNAA